MIDRDFWAGRRVFVTGHTGFKGSWLSLWLQKLGAELTGFSDRIPTDPSLFALANIEAGMDSITGDVCSLEQVKSSITATQPEVVIHMAAQSLVRPSYSDPVSTYMTNVMGTVHVLEAARQTSSVKSVVVVTSDKCYENREWIWPYRERDPMGGYDPYSNSKSCAELVSSAYRQSFPGGATITSGRAGNVIGGGDWSQDRLVTDVMHAALNGETLYIRNPDAIRPWQHVLNPLSGYLALAQASFENPDFAGGWNFGPDNDDTCSVSALIDLLESEWGEIPWEQDPNDNPHEARSLRLDSSQANALLSWQPTWKLAKTAQKIADFYRVFRDGGNIRATVLDQIGEFETDIQLSRKQKETQWNQQQLVSL